MDKNFWLARWEENRIGFHADLVQPLLDRFWPGMAPEGGRVLVPLCGKTLDMAWLAARGHDVIGVDVSAIAGRAFMAEQGLGFSESVDGAFVRLHSPAIDFLVGDFLALSANDVGPCRLAYDRAALIALPPTMRQAYADQICLLLEAKSDILLITIEYDPSGMTGPPFSVPEDEVRRLYSGHDVERIHGEDCLEREPRFRARGLEWMREVVYHLRLRDAS